MSSFFLKPDSVYKFLHFVWFSETDCWYYYKLILPDQFLYLFPSRFQKHLTVLQFFCYLLNSFIFQECQKKTRLYSLCLLFPYLHPVTFIGDTQKRQNMVASIENRFLYGGPLVNSYKFLLIILLWIFTFKCMPSLLRLISFCSFDGDVSADQVNNATGP